VKIFNLNGDEWDRTEEREGWRFKDAWVGAHTDAELIGAPWIVVVGRRLAEGFVELRDRATGQTRDVPLVEIAGVLSSEIGASLGRL